VAAKKRIYMVGSEATPTRLVKASSKVQAINHVVKSTFGAALPSQEELITLIQGGAQVEDADEVEEQAAGEQQGQPA